MPYQYQFADQYGNPLAVGAPTPPMGIVYPKYVMDPGIRNPFIGQPSNYNAAHAAQTLAPQPLQPQTAPFYNPSLTYNVNAQPTSAMVADYQNYPTLTPQVPLRRLFQIPDTANAVSLGNANHHYSGAAEYLFMSEYPAATVLGALFNPYNTGNYNTNSTIYHEQLYNPTANLLLQQRTITPPGSTVFPNPQTINQFLGAMPMTTPANPNATDNRQHPYYRTELLQKVMNLTTVRTHQFAVWITIGFFEVLQEGSAVTGTPDFLGGEIGLAAGTNIRYRSFFLLDRTRAVGFDPYEPGDFRDVVIYRRRIE